MPKRSARTKTRASTRCRVDGKKLRTLREDAELSIRELAQSVDIDPKTITDLEAGRREWSYLRVVRSIAAHPAINVAWRDLLITDAATASPQVPAARPITSSLDVYVEEERNGAKLAPLAAATGQLASFGATQLVNVFSSPSSYAGEAYYVRGHVVAQRGLAPGDGWVLGIDPHAGSRFAITRRVGEIEAPFSLAVITTNAEHTRALQTAWESQHEVTFAVRVVVAHAFDDGDIRVVGLDKELHRGNGDPNKGKQWRGFLPIAQRVATETAQPARPHPWTLVVTACFGPAKSR